MELARRQSNNFTEDREGGSAADLQIDWQDLSDKPWLDDIQGFLFDRGRIVR